MIDIRRRHMLKKRKDSRWSITHTKPTLSGQQPYLTSQPKKNKAK